MVVAEVSGQTEVVAAAKLHAKQDVEGDGNG